MTRPKLPIPKGLIGRSEKPVLLYSKARPFAPFSSYVQFMVVMVLLAAVMGAITLFAFAGDTLFHAQLTGALIGATVGMSPSIMSSMPYGLRLHTPRPEHWLAFTRDYLVFSRCKKVEGAPGPGQELWISERPRWRVWPNSEVIVFADQEEIYVTGPRSMILPLSRNWKRMEALGPMPSTVPAASLG
jgi:hypothetical protein